ncbi:hypothetical protein GCM10011390_48460 [Aureimonas endophytica]|uniref:Tetratricopeptide repeat protein n=1 Tax=Aureimonas endophytica TaxID=2027858 RepID=A0A917ECC1_9HYPH|nr:hypothetical protein [Aureimonas endophytica]GGE23330.1 hypothetical protein GCM10011390_48460 [Aureimonas endophytica]
MPSLNRLLLSSSFFVLALGGTSFAAGPTAPDFGNAAPVNVASASVAVPASLGAAAPTRPVAPGENPFAAPPAPIQAPAAAATLRPGINPFAAAPAPAAAPATATPASPFEPTPPPADAAKAEDGATDGAVDETALRYYASTRNLARVGAEIRRLKALHPDWQPPADLFAQKAAVDESELWDLFAKKDFAGLDAAMAARVKAQPDWKPSDDLAGKVAVERARFEIGSAASRSDWNGVVTAAGKNAAALTCGNIDLLWSLGEGYARLQNFARSFDLYSYILKSCDDPAQRMATYQKAALLLPPQGMESLAALGRPQPDGRDEFGSLRFDPLRRQMAAVASGDAGSGPDQAQLDGFAAAVATSRSQGDALLFGWYLYALKDFSGATAWFKAAGQLGPDPKAIEGQILALRSGGQTDEAVSLAFTNRARAEEIAKLYIEMISTRLTENDAAAVLDAATIRDFSGAVDQARSALGAQSLGWNLLAQNRLDDARGWFEKSVSWQPTQEGVTGLAVVAARSKNPKELREITQRFGNDFPELASLKAETAERPAAKAVRAVKSGGGAKGGGGGGGSQLMAEANAAFKSRNYAEALALLDKQKAKFGHNGGAELLRGWANLKLGRYDEARRVFKAENSRKSTKDTRFGIGAVSNEQYSMWE